MKGSTAVARAADPEPGPATEHGPLGDTWGGLALVLLLASTLGHPLASRLLDGAHLVTDSLGRATTVSDGRAGTLVGVGLFAAAVGAATLATITPAMRGFRSLLTGLLQCLVVWWVVLSVLIPRADYSAGDLLIVGAIPLALAVACAPPSLVTVRRVNLMRDLFATAQFLYPFLAPDIAQLPCREDKCGIFGTMHTGFYTQENSGVGVISLLLPLAATSSTPRLAYASGMSLLVALASGSRTGTASVLVAIAVAVWIRHRVRNAASTIDIPLLIRIAPLAATVISLALFLFADPTALTGRGGVYAANLNALQGPAMLYGVPWDTVPVASDGYLISDHGLASHMLAKSGIVGFALWAAAMVVAMRLRRASPEQGLALAMLAAGAARMLTESTFELEARSPGFLTLLLVMGLAARQAPERTTPPAAGNKPTDRRHRRVLSAAGAALFVAVASVPWILPVRHTATTVLTTSVPVRDSTAGEESSTARLTAAASVAFLAERPELLDGVIAQVAPGQVDPSDVDVAIRRPPLSTSMRISTTAPEADLAAAVNDAVATRVAEAVTSDSDGLQTVVSVRGPSEVTQASRWRENVQPLWLAAVIAGLVLGALAVFDEVRRGRRSRYGAAGQPRCSDSPRNPPRVSHGSVWTMSSRPDGP